jgi:hypothetical protein
MQDSFDSKKSEASDNSEDCDIENKINELKWINYQLLDFALKYIDNFVLYSFPLLNVDSFYFLVIILEYINLYTYLF